MRCFALLLLLAPAPLAQSVWTVSSTDPNADFADIQPAVDAAASGDVVLVRAGTYGSFEIDGKSLTVTNDAASVISMSPTALPGAVGEPETFVRVRNLAAGQQVTIRGIDLFSSQVFLPTVGAHITNNVGSVWIEDSTFSMLNPFTPGSENLFGMQIENSASVTLVDCLAGGGRASEGLVMADSSVWAYGGAYQGGVAGSANTPGGDGLRMVSGSFFASGSEFIGGLGGDSLVFVCPLPSPGGNGIRLDGGTLRELDCSYTPGTGGQPGICPWAPAPDGLDVAELGGTRIAIADVARSLATPSPVYVGSTLQQTFTGEPGEWVFQTLGVLLGTGLWVPGLYGPTLFTGPQFTRFRGIVGAGGTLSKNIPLSDFGLDGVTIYVQPLFIDAAIEFHAGAPTAVVLLSDTLLP